MNELFIPGNSAVHRTGATVKLLLTLIFLIFLGLIPFGTWIPYLLFFVLLLSAEFASKIQIGYFLKRAFIALPFVLAAIPLVFSGPDPSHGLILPGKIHLTISDEGVVRFISIALKSWISVQAAILLTATTRFNELLAALRGLRTPALFVAVLSLMWRYLAIIIDEAQSMLHARASRSVSLPGVRQGGSIAWRARVTGGMAGALFLRSLERSDRVYAAMLSRGYNGDLPAITTSRLPAKDLAVLSGGILVLVVLWLSHFVV